MNPTKVKKMNVTRYTPLGNGRSGGMMDHPTGDYVSFKDYQWMAEYADKLVEFGNLPCLPKDLENLREANAQFATENQALKEALASIKRDLVNMTL
jgi:hypothetical protein